jgi:N-acetylmuramoyl-L-alanine amidase
MLSNVINGMVLTVSLATGIGTIAGADQQRSAFNYEEVKCLAQNIYFEARTESSLGQTAVAWVTLNRVDDPNYPDTICDVVWDRKQFSWTHDGKSDRPRDRSAWTEAQYVAYQVLRNQHFMPDPTEGSVMFHAAYVKPYWTKKYEKVVRIDDHIFYK